MKLSRKFVSDYVSIDVDSKTLAEDMTGIGNEYDTCQKLIPATKLVIGEVIDCYDHPDSDHLHVCKVNVGKEVLQIVCGAPNVRKGLKVIVALDGAELPGGTIHKGMIRGQESNGMLCSIAELGLEHKFLTPKDVEGIHELPLDAEIGTDPIRYMELDDEVIDFELTSNRGDLLSILGMAYEIGALYGKEVKEMDVSYQEQKESIEEQFRLDIRTENCPLFLAKKVVGVTIKESPTFIKNRLIASGIRPINNVVDISNYVMLETGQPLHYYDADRLGEKIIVRMAEEGEKLTTLDSQERTLSSSDIVIATDKEAVGLAGVMGGLTTEIENDTKNILIESAIFHPTFIRKTSKKVLRSEASNRFEKGLDPRRTYLAIERSCHLLEKYADAKILSGCIEYKKMDIQDKVVEVSLEKINQVLGISLKNEEVFDILHRLQFPFEEKDSVYTILVPTRRTDVSIKEDIIEEVGRIYGIDRIQGKKMCLPVVPGTINPISRVKRYLRNKLATMGLNETLSYALTKAEDGFQFTTVKDDEKIQKVKVLDPMSEERTTLRYSLIPSLLSIFEYNKARNLKDVSIFEIGKGFYKDQEGYHEEEKLALLMTGVYEVGLSKGLVDFYVVKGIMEELLDSLGYARRYDLVPTSDIKELHPGQSAKIMLNNQEIGLIGKVHPSKVKEDVFVLEIYLEKLLAFRVKKMQYKEISKYPSILKDVAFVISKEISAKEIELAIKKAGGKLLTDIRVFDVYEGENVGEGEKSIAFSLTFEDSTRTLSDDEVMTIFNRIIEEVEKKFHAQVRDR